MNAPHEPMLRLPRLNRKDAVFLCILLFVTLLFHISIVFQWHIPLDSDSLLFFYPLRALHDDPGAGYWDPYLFCGFPRDGNTQSQITYPPNLLFLILPTAGAYSVVLMGHYLFAGFCVYCLLRGFRLSPESSAFGALAFLLSTFWRCKITNLGLLEGISWMPALLFFYLYSFEWKRWTPALIAAIALAFSIMAGVPHTMVYAVLMIAIITLVYCVSRYHSIFFCLGIFTVTTVSAVLLTTGVWYPALLYAPDTVRSSLQLSDALGGSIDWRNLWKIFFGGLSQPEISRCDPWEGTCYFGVSALLMLPFAWRGLPPRILYSLLFMILISILFTLGEDGYLYVLLFKYIPGWDTLNMPNRSLFMAAIALPILIAFGIEEWIQKKFSSKRSLYILCLFVAICLIVFIYGYIQNPWALKTMFNGALTATFIPDSITPNQWTLLNFCYWASITLLVLLLFSLQKLRMDLTAALLCFLLIAQAAQYSPRLFLQTTAPDFYDTPQTIRKLQEALQERKGRAVSYTPFIDSGSDVRLQFIRPAMTRRLPEVFRIHEIQGYDPMMPRRYAELVRAWARQHPAADPVRVLRIHSLPKAMLDFLGVRYIIGHPNQENLYTGTFTLSQPDEISSSLPQVKTITGLSFRWMLAGASNAPQGYKAGSVRVMNASDVIHEFPIRIGENIANYMLDFDQRLMHRPTQIYRWFPIPAENGYRQVMQYIANFELPQPAQADRIAIHWLMPQGTLVIKEINLFTDELKGLNLLNEAGELPLYENKEALPFTYLTRRVVRYTHLEQMIESLERRKSEDSTPVFLEQDQVLSDDSPPIPTTMGERERIEYLRDHSDRIQIKTQSQYDGILVIMENHATGWKARLDGMPVEIFRANHAFMAVSVPAGEHTITLRYVPRSFYMGWTVGGSTWIMLVVLIAIYGKIRWNAVYSPE